MEYSSHLLVQKIHSDLIYKFIFTLFCEHKFFKMIKLQVSTMEALIQE